MKFIDYSPLALRTAKLLPHDQQVQHALLGLVTEVGELADCVKKHVVYGKELDKVNLMEEVGDLAFYLNLYMHETHIASGAVDVIATEEPLQGWELLEQVLELGYLVGYLTQTEPTQEIVGSIAFLLLNILGASGFTLSDALTRNIDKLALRYGDKYSDYSALNRDTAVERTALEGVSGG